MPPANRKSRPWVQVKNALHRKLLKMTFQSYEEVGTAMAMAGVSKGWRQVAKKIGCKADDIKSRLNDIVHRRNKIVHEGDLRRLQRPRVLKLNDIDGIKVSNDLDWLEQLIAGIDAVA